MAVDTASATNRYVYVCASRDVAGAWRNQVLRHRVAADGSWTDQLVLIADMIASARHNGCALGMDTAGKLWVGMGDAGTSSRAQDPDSLNGKVLRVEHGPDRDDAVNLLRPGGNYGSPAARAVGENDHRFRRSKDRTRPARRDQQPDADRLCGRPFLVD